MVVDWSIRTKHWSAVGGVVDYFTWGHTKSKEDYSQVNVIKQAINVLGQPIANRGSPQFKDGMQVAK